jgi:hypothetical protein
MRRTRLVIALLPWLALAGAVSGHMLWFAQRWWGYRLIAWCACAAVSLALCWRPRSTLSEERRGVQVAVAALAALLGLQGVAFGLSPVGVILSIGLSAAAVLAWHARSSGRTGSMKTVATTLAVVFTVGATESAVRLLHVGEKARESDSRDLARRFNNLTPPRSVFVNQPSPLDEFPPALIEINSMGIRGREIPKGPVDLLLLGDSFVEARQLPWEQTVGPRLQEAVSRRAPGTRVVSHGMRGWSPLLEWNWYLKIGRQLRPRHVLLFFFWNDLWPAGTEVRTFRAVLDARGRPDHFEAQVDPDWLWYKPLRTVRIADEVVRLVGATSVRRVFQAASRPGTSAVKGLDTRAAQAEARRLAGDAAFSREQIDALLTRPLAELPPDLRRAAGQAFWPGIRPLEIWSPQQRDAAGQTERELAAFADDLRADNGSLTIVYVPNPLQVGSGECSVGRLLDRVEPGVQLPPDSGVQAWLRSVTARHGIEFLDPSGSMRQRDAEATGQAPFYLRADCHWSPAGHDYVASWLADWYERRRDAAEGR